MVKLALQLQNYFRTLNVDEAYVVTFPYFKYNTKQCRSSIPSICESAEG